MSGPRSAGGAGSARDVPSRNPALASRSTASAGTHEIVVTDPSTRTPRASRHLDGQELRPSARRVVAEAFPNADPTGDEDGCRKHGAEAETDEVEQPPVPRPELVGARRGTGDRRRRPHDE